MIHSSPAPAPALAEIAPRKTLLDLEWSRLLDALADRCQTALGKDLAHALAPFVDADRARAAIREVREAIASQQQGEPLPVPELPDVREAHQRAAHGGVLSPTELRAVAEVLVAARGLRRFLHARRADLPALFASCSADPSLDAVEDEISRAFDADGTLSDRASPRLREMRAEYATSRARMISRIEELMRRYATVLQDGFWTEREGRYVLPVRSDAHERFPGIVHASSGSGSTLFVEPRIVIPLGNRLKMLEGEVRREEQAVYASLTARVAQEISAVEFAIEVMGRADLRAAAAKLARDLSLVFPEPPESELASEFVRDALLRARDAQHGPTTFVADLRNLRHPLLVLEAFGSKTKVVPSDLRIAAGRALVISGPNAGGKTVALKALGLSSLMLRSGLPIAAAEGSVLGLVEAVLTDVGDDQSLQKSLSTFSAHVMNLAHILDAACPGALVLLDELAGGTDPREGEALAAAVLDALCRRGAAVLATTHYEGLKALAVADDRFQNASVGFDEATLSPTFRLALGVPGASSALSVARRFGVPSLVIERAEAYLSGEERSFEQTVRALNDERRALELARAAAEEEADRARGLRLRLEADLEELRQRDKRIVHHEAEALLASVRRAREDVRAAQALLRSSKRGEADTLQGAQRAIDAVGSRFALGGDLGALIDPDPSEQRGERIGGDTKIGKGTKVFVTRLRAEAEVIETLADGQLRVAAGSMKLTVSRDAVRVLVEGSSKTDGPRPMARGGRSPRLQSSHARSSPPPPRTTLAGEAIEGEAEPVIQTADNTVDVRGLRVDDAWPMVESFLDRALNAGNRLVIAVHGHGTGALRDKLREELTISRYVAKHRPGRSTEGGEGVTVIWLR